MFRITFATKKEIIKALKEKAEEKKCSRSRIINEILQEYFEEQETSKVEPKILV